ncbi:MAG TPA: hemerythrin domain-containing protein [Gammaproteobacteria bacterium]|nr:hemerythrin domain-containing protein [Gammaproteobacteria bacterium]
MPKKASRRKTSSNSSNSSNSKSSNLRSKVTAKMFEAAKEQQDRPKDALELLKTDHQEVAELFDNFGSARTAAQKKALIGEICLALSIHTRIEEDVFYPAAKKALDEDDRELVLEAKVEHATLKDLIAQVESAPESEEFEAKVKVMSEYVQHHVREEETQLFPRLQSAALDLDQLGQKLQARKLELLDGFATKSSRLVRPQKPSSLFRQRSARSGRTSSTRQQHARG